MYAAISQKIDKNIHGICLDILEKSYSIYFEKLGINLVPISNYKKNIKDYFKDLPIKALILSGGGDIGEEERDRVEKEMIEIAIKKELPILGICRGMQCINSYFGGTIKKIWGHVGNIHRVKILEEKYDKFFDKKRFTVNSFHNYGFYYSDISKELKGVFISRDGIVEGIYHPKLPILAIQWHPERKGSDEQIDKKIMNIIFNKWFWEKK